MLAGGYAKLQLLWDGWAMLGVQWVGAALSGSRVESDHKRGGAEALGLKSEAAGRLACRVGGTRIPLAVTEHMRGMAVGAEQVTLTSNAR